MMLNIVFFGPPGSGKGTQSERIATKYNMTQLSTGNLLREEIANQTQLGLKVQELVNKGSLVPDDIILNIIKHHIKNDSNETLGYIFDGFPRTKQQAKDLDNLLSEYNSEISIVISLIVKEDEIKNRLLNRSKELNRFDDSSIEIIDNRIKEYHNKTAAVSEFYKEKGKLIEINGSNNIDTVSKDIIQAIDKKLYENQN